jgi:hypothetical protein
MGFFDSLFGPSWEERVAEFMQERRLLVVERMRLCVKVLTPTADVSDIANGHPLAEIKKYLAGLDNHEEMIQLAVAMHMRKAMRAPVVALKMGHETKWQVIVLTVTRLLPTNDEVRYRRFENDGVIIWNPIDESGEDLAPCPK